MAYKLITPPLEEPLTLLETKLHLRVDATDEDNLIHSLIIAARETCEGHTHRKFITQTWERYLDHWPQKPKEYIELMPGVQAVNWVKYFTRDGTEHIFDPAQYRVDIMSGPGRVVLMPDCSWPPDPLLPANGICVRFTCGYGSAQDVPATIKAAMLLLIGHWFEHREAVNIERGTPLALPFTVNALLAVETVMVV